MWIDIRTLAKALGKTPRTIQIRIRKDSSIQTRMRDKKTTEVYIPSLPAEWQTAVAKSEGIDVNRQALATLAPSAQLVAASQVQ